MQRRQGARPQPATAQRLNSWKEIAAYLGTSERTVQRWEQGEALPVHRHVHDKASSIYAYPEELEDWLKRRQPCPRRPTVRKPKRPAPPVARGQAWLWWLAALAAAAVSVWSWRQ
jgi:transcriptional regulator with XRE-family HTH domain